MRRQISYALLQAWYCIIEGGLLVGFNIQFFFGKGATASRILLIPLILVQMAFLGPALYALQKHWQLGPLLVLAHTVLMCGLSLGTLPFREQFGPFDVVLPLILHGGLAALALNTLTVPPDNPREATHD